MDIIGRKNYYTNGRFYEEAEAATLFSAADLDNAYKGTIAYSILSAHSTQPAVKGENLAIRFDAMASHDITYVGIIQTAKASGLKEFPLPYVLTNCHNSLCAVGGTINEDDHVFGLSACKKYGGMYVPANQAVIHTYMRERFAACGKMILGSDSHTRYGALGTMAIGEGGPELVKQLLRMTYDVKYPDVIAIELTGSPKKGVGPHDVAIALITAVFKAGIVKNKVLEFVGDGIDNLPVEYRNGIDVMTTETACLTSIWRTDSKVHDYFAARGRAEDYKQLEPAPLAMYDGVIKINLSEIEPMIALPFHPGNGYRLADLIANPYDVLTECEQAAKEILGSRARLDLRSKIRNGGVYVDQAVIAGCAGGTFDNICLASSILKGASIGNDAFTMSVYPSSQPVYAELARNGRLTDLVRAGVTVKSCFCGPCFGAGDVPSNNGFSIRHTTRNFESREGSKPSDGQIASVALMDALSIAATAKNGGRLTCATDVDYDSTIPQYVHDCGIYEGRVYNGIGKPNPEEELVYGPNITDWPKIPQLTDNLLLKLVAVINDPVTTTDELIPSGETSSYRSNPMRLASYALSRKVPEYVSRAKAVAEDNTKRFGSTSYDFCFSTLGASQANTMIESAIFAIKPGDGSAREQAASCQRVLGGGANFAREYATKRYRSNLINWGILPFVTDFEFELNDIVFVPEVRAKLAKGDSVFPIKVVRGEQILEATAELGVITDAERSILLEGCLMNYYTKLKK